MDEITLTQAGIRSEKSKTHFLPFLAAQKFIAHADIQIHVTGSILIGN